MSRVFLNFFILLISFSFFNYGCKTGMQATSFKDSKHSIDTLVLYTPIVVVEAASRSKQYLDEELSLKLYNNIADINTATLKRKYNLESEPFFLEPSLDSAATVFFNSLDSLKTGMEDVSLPVWLNNDQFATANRYFMATFVYGYYHPDYEPNFVFKESLQTSTIFLGSPRLNWLSIKILLADRKDNKILFYNADSSHQSDPRLLSSVEAMVMKLIKPVYYR